jgi:thioredoxin 1
MIEQNYFKISGGFSKTCLNVRGLPSLNTCFEQYCIEKAAICSSMGFNAFPFFVIVYSIFTGVPEKTFLSMMPSFSISRNLAESVFGLIPSIESKNSLNLFWPSCILRKMCTVNFFPIILKVLSIGHAFIPSINTLHSSSFNLPYPHLISLLSLSNLYSYLCIVTIEKRGDKKIENQVQNKAAHVKETTSSELENEIEKSEIPVFVDFWAPWCGPCRAVAPIVEEIASEYSGKVSFVKVNIDENNEIASRYNVFSIPTLAVFSEGNLVSQQVGVSSNAKTSLKNMIENALKKI